jgi:GNAT superfamily N-acetyltransferase
MKESNFNDLSSVELYRQAEDYFFRAISSSAKDFCDEATAYKTGAPVGDLNPVFVKKDTLSFEEILRESKSFYGSLPYAIVIPGYFLEHESLLKSKGYAQTSESYCMMLDLNLLQKEIILKDALKIFSTDKNLSEWMLPLMGGFDCPLETVSLYAKAHEKALLKNLNLYHFTLYQNEDSITSVTLSVNQTLARIDDLATVPKHQRKRYGAHLLRYALQEAKKKGGKYCFLESSDTGFSLYEKCGFKTLFKNQIYEKMR